MEELDFGTTNYAFSAGDSIFSAAEGPPFNANPLARTPRGVFGHNSRIRPADLLDGTSSTIAMTERVKASIPYLVKGGTAEVAGIDANPSLCKQAIDANGRLIGTTVAWTGHRWHDGRSGYTGVTIILPPNSPSCTLDATNPGAPGLYTASSHHPGGVVVLFCDGSVRLIADEIDAGADNAPTPTALNGPSPYGVWGKLSTRRGREIVDGY
jgi:prepilin-type processing-associated H-X9-DG protein